jgi:hypothetical protein
MAELEQPDLPPEGEQEAPGSDDEAPNPRVARMLNSLSADEFLALIDLAKKSSAKDSREMKALKDAAPEFSGDFINFVLKESLLADILKEAPSFPMFIEKSVIPPLKRVAAKDATEVKAMDERLAEISANLQVAIQYLYQALSNLEAPMPDAVVDGVFCGLCMTAQSFAALQVERHTTPTLRGRISEAASGSQVPSIVKQAQKFFRGDGGSTELPTADTDDGFEPMVKKKRERRPAFYNMDRSLVRTPRAPQPGPKFFQPYSYGRGARNPGRGYGRGRGFGADRPP